MDQWFLLSSDIGVSFQFYFVYLADRNRIVVTMRPTDSYIKSISRTGNDITFSESQINKVFEDVRNTDILMSNTCPYYIWLIQKSKGLLKDRNIIFCFHLFTCIYVLLIACEDCFIKYSIRLYTIWWLYCIILLCIILYLSQLGVLYVCSVIY
jgi:hypothetical protein